MKAAFRTVSACLAAALLCFAAHAAPPADLVTPDGGAPVDAAADAASLDEQVRASRDELRSLTAFREGRLGPIRSAELFRVDLLDDAAVARRASVVRAELDGLVASSARDGGRDAGVEDAGAAVARLLEGEVSEDVERDLRAEVSRVRAEILSLPRDVRQRLLVAQDEAARAEAARRDRAQAERELEVEEEARLKALQDAREAESVAARKVAEARARVAEVRGEQLRARARLVESEQRGLAEEAQATADVAALTATAASVGGNTAQADALYDRIVDRLVGLRRRVAELLDVLERRERGARVGELDLPPARTPEEQAEIAQLGDAARTLDAAAEANDVERQRLAWEALHSAMASEGRLNRARIELLGEVSAAKRAEVLGFGAAGRAQGFRELERVKLEARWLRATSGEQVRAWIAELRRPAALAALSLDIVALVVLAWAATLVRRRRGAWLRACQSFAARAIRRGRALRAVQLLTSAVDAIGDALVTLGAVVLVPSVLGLDVHAPPWSVVYSVLLWYAMYRLALDASHRGLAWMVAHQEGGLVGRDPALGDRILRSVRLVARSAFLFSILLASSAAVVGRGYLHALVVRAAWMMALAVAALLVRRWRADIARAYLRVRPNGALSRVVARTQDRFVGFFVTVAAFVVLFAGALLRAMRRFVLGFEQSRKALAYIFRRRLEKKVEHVRTTRPLLDEGALEFFTEGPVEDHELVVDRFPGLGELAERIAQWRDGGRSCATLVVGRTGFGKTTWLRTAQERCSVPFTLLPLSMRATTRSEVLGVLAEKLGLGAAAAMDEEAMVARLLEGPRRVVAIDDAQLWFLRGVGQLEGFRALSTVIERSAARVMWIVAFAHYPWEFLSWLSKGDHVFRHVVHLAPWSEAEIAGLLERRNAASNLAIVYDDLLVDAPGAIDERTQILTTARDYNRLVWDYSEGSPRVALHVWGRSLVPDGPARARVRLFAIPDASLLERLSESAKFVLAAIVWHERLALDEALVALRLPRAACEQAFDRLIESGVVERRGSEVLVRPRWWPVVVRYLRRKHLIET